MGSVALFTETIFVAESRGRISQTWLAGTWLLSAVIFIVIAIIYYFLCRWKYSSRMTCDSGFNINYIVRVKEGQKKQAHTHTLKHASLQPNVSHGPAVAPLCDGRPRGAAQWRHWADRFQVPATDVKIQMQSRKDLNKEDFNHIFGSCHMYLSLVSLFVWQVH